jgi:uncharacterized protein YjbI with pentapeptide repeats
MANPEHLARLKSGVAAWNAWRQENNAVRPDLSGADLHCECLDHVDLHGADLRGADLTHAIFHEANFCDADMSNATVVGTNFCQAQLRGAIMVKANVHRTNFDRADLTGANLTGANLERTMLVGTIVENASFSGCKVYGVAAWDLELSGVKDQTGLQITRDDQEEKITVDNLQIAQFVYLLLHNAGVRDVIEAVSNKGVLLIGRLTGSGGEVLHAIREELKTTRKLLPIMFEFAPVPGQDTMRTLTTLAHLCRFVIADLTDAQSVLQELQAICLKVPGMPVQPLLRAGSQVPPMADSFLLLPSVHSLYRYSSKERLLADFDNVIGPVEGIARQMEAKLAEIRRTELPWQGIAAPQPQ